MPGAEKIRHAVQFPSACLWIQWHEFSAAEGLGLRMGLGTVGGPAHLVVFGTQDLGWLICSLFAEDCVLLSVTERR